jgi:hypothetical protein
LVAVEQEVLLGLANGTGAPESRECFVDSNGVYLILQAMVSAPRHYGLGWIYFGHHLAPAMSSRFRWTDYGQSLASCPAPALASKVMTQWPPVPEGFALRAGIAKGLGMSNLGRESVACLPLTRRRRFLVVCQVNCVSNDQVVKYAIMIFTRLTTIDVLSSSIAELGTHIFVQSCKYYQDDVEVLLAVFGLFSQLAFVKDNLKYMVRSRLEVFTEAVSQQLYERKGRGCPALHHNEQAFLLNQEGCTPVVIAPPREFWLYVEPG